VIYKTNFHGMLPVVTY